MPCQRRCVDRTSGDMRREGGDGELICWLAGSAAAAMVSSPNKVTS
jgi:hypothetical protein